MHHSWQDKLLSIGSIPVFSHCLAYYRTLIESMSTTGREALAKPARSMPLRQQSEQPSLSLLFWGTESLFSAQVLSHLVAVIGPAIALQAVMLPATAEQPSPVQQLAAEAPTTGAGELPLLTHFVTPTTRHLAWQQGLPVYSLRSVRHHAVHTLLQTLAPDLVAVACFPWRIPPDLLAIPTHGFVNLHPSLLPAYRGPAPLFWQLRAGVQQSGVTLHQMAPTFDSGAIIAQQPLTLPDGASGPALDQAYAELGATLLHTFLTELAVRGTLHSHPQPAGGSTQSWPQATDFALDLGWSARHAFNFMRGTAEWGHPYPVTSQGTQYTLRSALRYEPAQQLPNTVMRQESALAIQFTPGVLYALPLA
jgi:methionyl-tRNA formyltransferase